MFAAHVYILAQACWYSKRMEAALEFDELHSSLLTWLAGANAQHVQISVDAEVPSPSSDNCSVDVAAPWQQF